MANSWVHFIENLDWPMHTKHNKAKQNGVHILWDILYSRV